MTVSYRYWRVKATTASTFVGATEVQFRTSYAGPQAATGGTAMSDSAFSGLPASNAFDNTSAAWACNGTGTASWIGYDFGSAVTILEVAYTCRNFTDFGQIWTAATVDGSNDGSTWTPVATLTPASWTYGGQTQTFTVQGSGPSAPGAGLGSHRYWRVRGATMDTASNGFFGVEEVTWRTSIGGVQVASGGTAIADSQNSGITFAPSHAYDGTAAIWASAGVGSWSWIGYDFGTAVRICEVAVKNRNDSSFHQIINSGTVDSSDDGVNWSPAVAITPSLPWTQGQTQTFTVQSPSAPASTRPQVFCAT
jgi:hypothetical protein